MNCFATPKILPNATPMILLSGAAPSSLPLKKRFTFSASAGELKVLSFWITRSAVTIGVGTSNPLTRRLRSARRDGESRDVLLRPNRSIRARIGRERHQFDHVGEIRSFRSAVFGMQLPFGRTARRRRQSYGDDGIAGPNAEHVHRAARIGTHAVESDLQSVLKSGGRSHAQVEGLSGRDLIRCRRRIAAADT